MDYYYKSVTTQTPFNAGLALLCTAEGIWDCEAVTLPLCYGGGQLKSILWPVVLYDCETWSLALREKNRLTVFENRILKWIFETRRDENGEWRRLHSEELYCLYHLCNIVRMIKSRKLRWAGHVARMGEGRCFKIWHLRLIPYVPILLSSKEFSIMV
jgi:hypothetical protein